MTNNIEAQTKALSDQVSLLEQLAESGDDVKNLLELEKYNLMLKGADLSLESQTASKKRKLKWYDKAFVPSVRRLARGIKKVNRKLEKHNKERENQ